MITVQHSNNETIGQLLTTFTRLPDPAESEALQNNNKIMCVYMHICMGKKTCVKM